MIANTLSDWKKHKDYVQQDCGISPFKQLLQIAAWRLRGFNSQEYYMYPLYMGDPRPVIRTREYDQIQSRLNPVSKGVIPVDKWIQSAIWKAQGIAHAKVMGFARRGHGILEQQPYDGNLQVFRDFIVRQNFPFAIKPIDGSNGTGFDLILDYQRATDSLLLSTGGTLSLESFQEQYLNSLEGVLFQEKIIQHPTFSAVFPKSVNTVRVVTHRDNQERYQVLQAMVKFGGGDTIIDNDVFTGVLAEMELNTGVLGIARRRFGAETFDKHPDTGIDIRGMSVPFWQEALELAVNAHQLLPSPRHLGWDIAIAEDGPKVVEMNAYLSIAINQKIHGNKLDRLDS